MKIIAKCPYCGTSNWHDGTAADKRLRCSKCRRLVKVPSLDEVPNATKVLSRTKADVYVDENGKTYG